MARAKADFRLDQSQFIDGVLVMIATKDGEEIWREAIGKPPAEELDWLAKKGYKSLMDERASNCYTRESKVEAWTKTAIWLEEGRPAITRAGPGVQLTAELALGLQKALEKDGQSFTIPQLRAAWKSFSAEDRKELAEKARAFIPKADDADSSGSKNALLGLLSREDAA